ncbi:ASCH domain-containing protein [Mesorhizobium sp. M0309]|uniref:ASCH domain-containing protein n=1 Tax=Mesorhizobium sp. M0309 TaxID=2956933 RepID=UPI003336BB7A
MKGLIIDEPWIGLILKGEKTWEMRKTACHHRGPIALIKKGSGTVVGTAEVTGSLPAIGAREAYSAAEQYHRIPLARQGTAFDDGWRTAWVLSNPQLLPKPVPYNHPYGAVIWVNLEDDVVATIQADRAADKLAARAMSVDAAHHPVAASAPRPQVRPHLDRGQPGSVCEVRISGGNLRNNHIYLPLDFFPQDAIGGSNKSDLAERTIAVTFDPGHTVETDIDGTKRILRTRSLVADFFARTGMKAGDIVRIAKVEPYKYEIVKVQDA